MKKNYCFVRKSSGINPDDVIYKVRVGNSEREIRKLVLIQEYAKDNGLYFKLWDNGTENAISMLEHCVFGRKPFFMQGLLRHTIDIVQLYRLIMDDSFIPYEKQIHKADKRNQLFVSLSLIAPFSNNPCVSHDDCQTVPRKYLSPEKSAEWVKIAFHTLIFLVLFLLTAWMDAMGM